MFYLDNSIFDIFYFNMQKGHMPPGFLRPCQSANTRNWIFLLQFVVWIFTYENTDARVQCITLTLDVKTIKVNLWLLTCLQKLLLTCCSIGLKTTCMLMVHTTRSCYRCYDKMEEEPQLRHQGGSGCEPTKTCAGTSHRPIRKHATRSNGGNYAAVSTTWVLSF